MPEAIAGIDLGGTWVRGVRLDDPSATLRRPVPADPRDLSALLAGILADLGAPPIWGLAAAPELDRDGVVRRWPTRPEAVGLPLLSAVSSRPAVVVDDVTAAAFAEHGKLADDVITAAIWVGTGIGGGCVVAGRPLTGARGAAMDLGHVPVPAAAGLPCACGRNGCLQALVSAPAEALTAGLIDAVHLLCALVDPHRVVIGGGGIDRVPGVLDALAREVGHRVEVVPSTHGDLAPALGAARLAARAPPPPKPSRWRVAVVDGPNLGRLGRREPHVYGAETLDAVHARTRAAGRALGAEVVTFQSDAEHELVGFLHRWEDHLDGVVINPAGLTSGGLTLRDALVARPLPFVEVHISNVFAREAIHHASCFADVAVARVIGLGTFGYELALAGLVDHFRQSEPR